MARDSLVEPMQYQTCFDTMSSTFQGRSKGLGSVSLLPREAQMAASGARARLAALGLVSARSRSLKPSSQVTSLGPCLPRKATARQSARDHIAIASCHKPVLCWRPPAGASAGASRLPPWPSKGSRGPRWQGSNLLRRTAHETHEPLLAKPCGVYSKIIAEQAQSTCEACGCQILGLK